MDSKLCGSINALQVKFIRVILCFYPPFNMSKIYYDISKASSPTVDFFNGVVYQVSQR